MITVIKVIKLKLIKVIEIDVIKITVIFKVIKILLNILIWSLHIGKVVVAGGNLAVDWEGAHGSFIRISLTPKYISSNGLNVNLWSTVSR